MPVTIWTPALIRKLKKGYPYAQNTRDLADALGVGYGAMKSRVTMLGLKRKVINSRTTTSDLATDIYLELVYLDINVNQLSIELGRSETFVKIRLDQLGLKIPQKIINQRKRDSQIKKGNVPMNKGKKIREYMSAEAVKKVLATTFKKGESNHNELHDGAITIRHSMPYKGGHPHKYIRLSKGIWKELQIHNWEKKNGPVPDGFVLACKDGNTLNCRPSNWYLMTKKENMIRNSSSVRMTDGWVAQSMARVKGVRGKLDKRLMKRMLKHPELLDLKRQSIILKRTIHEQRKAS